MAQKILITGTSAGFGKLTAMTLLQQGHAVAASMRDPEGRNQAAAGELAKAGAKIVALDVTQDESVALGVASAIKQMGGLDVVIHNAGVGVLGLQEGFTPEDWKKLFEINVFGVQRVNRAALPHLRQQKSGLLLFIASILGRVTLPFYGPYNASKWAMEAMAENYRTELSGFGVDVAIIEPGGFPTSFIDRLMKPSDTARLGAYGDLAAMPEGMLKGFEQTLAANPQQNPQLVADAIAEVIATPAGKRAFRTAVDKMGMGAAIDPYNAQLAEITKNLYTAFGIDGMLKLAA